MVSLKFPKIITRGNSGTDHTATLGTMGNTLICLAFVLVASMSWWLCVLLFSSVSDTSEITESSHFAKQAAAER